MVLSAFHIKARYIIGLFVAVLGLFVVNAYIRGAYNFEQFWAGKGFHQVPSAFWYSFVQPVMYAFETFANLSSVLAESRWSGFVWSSVDGVETVAGLKEMGKIVPLFGVWAVYLGKLLASICMFAVFFGYWLLYRAAIRGGWLLVYCLLSPGLAMLWTAIITDSQGIYRVAFVMALWIMLVESAKAGRVEHANAR
jgi:hypothetical protein